MHISGLRTYPTLINYAIKVYEFELGPLGPTWVMTPLESNSKVDSTCYYRQSTILQYLM